VPDDKKRILMQKSLEIFSCVPRRYIVGKRPSTVAAATLYAAVNILREIMKYDSPWITQTEISTVSGVTEVSIRNHYRIIEQFYKKGKHGE
jgi:transcription initiation factor TFIIIB Brf1 subunit/transcription initiation factor TFIIB